MDTLTKISLPREAPPILPSQHRTEVDHHVASNIDSLTGVDAYDVNTLARQANMNSVVHQRRFDEDPVLVSDYLRIRNDTTLALHPAVSQVVPETDWDQLLRDLVRVYHERCRTGSGSLEPVPGFSEPALTGLNEGYDLAYLRPEFEIAPAEDYDCDGREVLPTSDFSIQIHDVFADLRSKGIVTNLAKSACDACGHKAGRELADQLHADGHTVHGYAGIAAESIPEIPQISIQDFDWSSWESNDVLDLVLETAEAHDSSSMVRVNEAELLG